MGGLSNWNQYCFAAHLKVQLCSAVVPVHRSHAVWTQAVAEKPRDAELFAHNILREVYWHKGTRGAQAGNTTLLNNNSLSFPWIKLELGHSLWCIAGERVKRKVKLPMQGFLIVLPVSPEKSYFLHTAWIHMWHKFPQKAIKIFLFSNDLISQ